MSFKAGFARRVIARANKGGAEAKTALYSVDAPGRFALAGRGSRRRPLRYRAWTRRMGATDGTPAELMMNSM
jgi:hypothetical protein